MTTELEIINAMLAVNGESPVSSADSTDPSAIQARNALTLIDRAIQSRGWWFNKEPQMRLAATNVGEVILPQNTLSVAPVDTRSNLVQRGTRLYDRKNSTYVINKSVVVCIVVQLEIEELPELAAAYIMAKAVKDYYTDDDGDENKINRLAARESEAFAYLQREHLAKSNVNIKDSPQGAEIMAATNMGSGIRATQVFNEEE